MPDNHENCMQDLTVVIPTYDENHEVLDKIVEELKKLQIEVIVVDDGSEKPYPESIKHGTNFGYGAALLTGIKNATRPLICTMDGDGQHNVGDVVNLYVVWRMLRNCSLLIGARRIQNEFWYRMFGRKLLNWIAGVATGKYFQDLNSGMRMFSRDIVMGYAPIVCKRFSFTTSITISMLCDGYRVESFPINVEQRSHGKSRVKIIRDGIVTLYYILRIGFALRTRRIRAWVRSLLSTAKIGTTDSI